MLSGHPFPAILASMVLPTWANSEILSFAGGLKGIQCCNTACPGCLTHRSFCLLFSADHHLLNL